MSYTIYYLALRVLCKGCYRISIVLGGFMWTGENDSNTIHVDAFFVFKNRKKNPHFRKYPDTCGLGLRVKVSCITSVDGIKLWYKVHDFWVLSRKPQRLLFHGVFKPYNNCSDITTATMSRSLRFWQCSPSVQWSIDTVHWYNDLIIFRHLWRDLVYGEAEQHLNRLILF